MNKNLLAILSSHLALATKFATTNHYMVVDDAVSVIALARKHRKIVRKYFTGAGEFPYDTSGELLSSMNKILKCYSVEIQERIQPKHATILIVSLSTPKGLNDDLVTYLL